MDELAALLQEQDGIITRAQALGAGATATWIARALRRGAWVAVHPGVYAEHAGPLTWQQRAWAAVLACRPAALYGRSARRAHEGPGRRDHDGSVIHVAVERHRDVSAPPWTRLHRVTGFETRVVHGPGPPRIGYHDTILDLAAATRDDREAVAVLSCACRGSPTAARCLLDLLDRRPVVPRRDRLRDLLLELSLPAPP
ncbi:type IV toxin-antitoxin system AbiEi family antitoxin domain-containing protein [Nocardioides sp.]|uniref:type IV toxin-antitoxin system AbiEi family antitoxin domain-containing protein n=1 Tax=Nocardioides sp. TaxID=35761 RepID=UPI002EDAFDB8